MRYRNNERLFGEKIHFSLFFGDYVEFKTNEKHVLKLEIFSTIIALGLERKIIMKREGD